MLLSHIQDLPTTLPRQLPNTGLGVAWNQAYSGSSSLWSHLRRIFVVKIHHHHHPSTSAAEDGASPCTTEAHISLSDMAAPKSSNSIPVSLEIVRGKVSFLECVFPCGFHNVRDETISPMAVASKPDSSLFKTM
ncbi:Hypp2010 [Branchiostoma lanceolatum]|uniref:Hypp2010 protein n=1 Tax=Branchiostoma lanceolatum TaxID=7740 RepID=A0A8J9ZQT6_BRALA|nr:Hypp2010 [Branchiostoma lanceolatum]